MNYQLDYEKQNVYREYIWSMFRLKLCHHLGVDCHSFKGYTIDPLIPRFTYENGIITNRES